MKNEQLPRREREKLRQRQEMLASALDLFSQKGFHNVSMHEVAGKAEFAIGTLYRFFDNKEELYKALILEQCDKFEHSVVEAMEKQGDEVEKLRSYVRARIERFHGNIAFIRLWMAERRGASFNIGASLDESVRQRHYSFLERLAAVFESGIRNKRFKEIAAPYSLALALDGIIDSFLLLWLDAPERHTYPEHPDIILNIFFKGLIDA